MSVTQRPVRKLAVAILLCLFCVGCGERKEGSDKTLNTAPFIMDAEILPQNPTLGSRIDLRIKAGDKEGDDITYTVSWILNERMIGTGLSMSLTEAEKGDHIYAEITPSDGRLTGQTWRTSTVTIANSTPKIMSARITPDAILTSTGDLTVVGDAIDLDGDPLTYFCSWTLDNKKITNDSSTTLQLDKLRLKKGSVLNAELYAFDGVTLSQPYTLEIAIVNSPPILRPGWDSIPYKPDSIAYRLPIFDPDGDEVSFEILEAPNGIRIDAAQGIVYGSVADTLAFEIVVRATDNEGAYLDAQFTVTPPNK